MSLFVVVNGVLMVFVVVFEFLVVVILL